MDENEMLDEMLTIAPYVEDRVCAHWDAMDSDQRIAAYTLFTSGLGYEPLECVEIACEGDYVLYPEYCHTLGEVAKDEFSQFDSQTMIRCLNDIGGWEQYVNWDLVGRMKDTVHNMVYSDRTSRWVELN